MPPGCPTVTGLGRLASIWVLIGESVPITGKSPFQVRVLSTGTSALAIPAPSRAVTANTAAPVAVLIPVLNT
ncbi:hypothetical protein GCM10010174_16750 [Kutzneria viridogrisea]